MQAQIAVGLAPARVCRGDYKGSCFWRPSSSQKWWPKAVRMPVVTAAYSHSNSHSQNHSQNHYDVLGVARSASTADIKKAYRLLARKWHPDVSKDSKAGEVFKNIRLAYDVLSNAATRIQYDRSLRIHENDTEFYRRTNSYHKNPSSTSDPSSSRRRRTSWHYAYNSSNNKDGIPFNMADVIRIVYGWDTAGQRRRRKQQQYQQHQRYSKYGYRRSSYDNLLSVIKLIGSPVGFLLLVQWTGCALPLSLSCLLALFDPELDSGYKLGYWVAWLFGGAGGVKLTLFLWFASWALGKGNSWMVSVVVMAICISSSLLRYCSIPQGALLALMYMSVKLQADLKSI